MDTADKVALAGLGLMLYLMYFYDGTLEFFKPIRLGGTSDSGGGESGGGGGGVVKKVEQFLQSVGVLSKDVEYAVYIDRGHYMEGSGAVLPKKEWKEDIKKWIEDRKLKVSDFFFYDTEVEYNKEYAKSISFWFETGLLPKTDTVKALAPVLDIWHKNYYYTSVYPVTLDYGNMPISLYDKNRALSALLANRYSKVRYPVIFIVSIHQNAGSSPSEYELGRTDIFYTTKNRPWKENSRTFAVAIHKYLKYLINQNGDKEANFVKFKEAFKDICFTNGQRQLRILPTSETKERAFWLLDNLIQPANMSLPCFIYPVLIEVGFINYRRDYALISNRFFRRLVSKAVWLAVQSVLDSIQDKLKEVLNGG